MADKPVSILTSLESMASLVKQTNELTVDRINNIDQATAFIKDNDKKITNSWFNMANALKKVRDEKLYEDKYSDFEDYFMNELKYKKTMVYNFIKLAEGITIENKEQFLNYGVTKLIALMGLEEHERDEFLQNNDIENMSVKEVTKKVKVLSKINLAKRGMKYNLSSDEAEIVQMVYGKILGFKDVEYDIADNIITHEKAVYFNEVLDETKKEVKKMEKVLKKYI